MPRRRVVSRDEPSGPEPDVKLMGDAALSVLRAGRAVAGGSGDAGRLHDAYNGLANLAGFPPLKEPKNAVALAEKCIALAIDIRSASWAIGCVEQPDRLPAFAPAQGDSDAPEAEVNHARHSLVACAPDEWGTGALRFALGHVLSVQSPIPAFLYGSLIEDVAKGIQASRQKALTELLRDIQRLPPHIGPPDLGPGGGIGI
ncbi:hypothetical protein Save01_03865 [Streptomyces avermitilis]|uniref:Uncharacterized protein n=1 Tax=Streptomyces avermitilis TaxID=33903 RepID=A0A4D4MXY2_STRAX|nr:hypothetical protein SAV31267_058000 [Streptomyces avermitilis]